MESERREVFFALIAPIGINLDAVEKSLSTALKNVAYTTNSVRLTDIFSTIDVYDTSFTDEYERYTKLISAGDALCKDTKRNDILALYGIQMLNKHDPREENSEIPKNVAHVFRQIKRVEEVHTFKEVYGRNIIFLSCYSSKQNRIDYLVKKLLKTRRGQNKVELESMALKIMSLDENEREKPEGQRVLDCYPFADFIIDCTDNSSLTRSCDRLINIYFGHPFISPTKDEYCSYFANAASYRSLDLSRQVGAAIFSDTCEIISLGCNEVPKAGGGTYWSESDSDHRDYAIGHDSNQQVKEDMARDALVRLQNGWLSEKYSDLSPNQLSFRAFEAPGAPLKSAMISDVIEYGRMVHAEMNAITDAARSRKSTQNATIYCTTMPCHLCTKLIIASGIKRAVYLQPYPKSLVDELFTDSVSIDEKTSDGRVIFETLKGVTPNGFRIAFRKTKRRKNKDGTALSWDPLKSSPTFLSVFPYYRNLEIAAGADLSKALSGILKVGPSMKKTRDRPSSPARKTQ